MTPGSLIAAGALFPLGGVVALAASYWLVIRLERVADRLHLSEITLGLLVAVAADSPEIASAVSASVHGQRSIGAGVVLGSNVFNLAALLGLGAIVAGTISMHRRVVLRDGVTATWVAVMSTLIVTKGLSAGLGIVLVLVVVVPYVFVSVSSSRTWGRLGLPDSWVAWMRSAVAEEQAELAEAIRPLPPGRNDVLFIGAAIAVVVASSIAMERSAETIGRHFGLSDLVVGGVILAAVTSLPNAVGAVFLATRGRGAAVLSEAMNSNMINVVVGLLLPGLFIGLGRPDTNSTIIVVWYAGLTVISLGLVLFRSGLTRISGVAIVAIYFAFLVVAVLR
jgi:cation:H+ antiporter